MDCDRNEKKRKRSPSPSAAENTSSASASASASASTSASASASPFALVGEYEVFLSFYGKDTRNTFTDFLYTSLVGARIRTFRDDNELRIGEKISSELLKAIKESQISIPIFSKNYASSKWCLRELSQMVECLETMGQKVFPIFFDVDPSDVRNQTGSYKAVDQHEEDEKIVQEWKKALKKVGELKGLELKKETNGRQGGLASQVTLKVLIELKKNYINVPENLLAIDRHVEKMMSHLYVYSSGVQIVGIHGMGGIGKTTIAKVVFNRLSDRFEGCCFLENVREKSQHQNGLVDLQNELCSTIQKREGLYETVNVNEGLELIKRNVCRTKVLIVLDDVDTFDQFDKLAGKREWFALGSRIIVTTRDKHVLNRIVVDSTYEPPPMESNHSLQLFSKHAFRRDFPPKEYDTLSRKFANIAAGLPLAIEIIGSYLCDKEISNWPGILEMLEEIPHVDVQKKLKLSYDTLNHGQQQIFLDIACYFIGEDKRVAFYTWDVCKFYPADGVDVLVLRSLVKIRDNNVLWMHDQLRDLGKDIIRRENFDEPWKRSRVWSHEDALKTMEKCKETQKDEAVKVEALRIESALFMESYFPFPKKNLRYLQVDEGKFLGVRTSFGTKSIFHRIWSPKKSKVSPRWLKWHGFSWRYGVTNFHPENLVILDLSRTNFRDNRESWNQIKMAKNLKVLNLTSCSGLIEIPDFSTFAALEMLILKNCQGFVKIDPSIGNLTSLRVLDISGSSTTKLPDAIGNLEKLEEINASYCWELEGEFPDIRRLSSLGILNLCGTKISSLPRSICELSSLQTLNLGNARLEWLPELPSSLTSLHVTCTSMKTFPSLSKLKSLKKLDIFRCHHLGEIPRDIEKLSKLETLNLVATSISTLPAEIGDLPRLKKLIVSSKNLQYIQGLPSSLFELQISNSKSMERLQDLSNLKNMSKLYLSWCSKLMDIECLGKFKSLTRLAVKGCGKLAKLDGLEKLESLRYLFISNCESLQRLPNLSNLKMLEELNLLSCENLAEVEGLSLLKSLEELDMSFCASLEGILDLSNLKKLKELKIRGWENLNAIHGFEELESLEVLDIAGCEIEKSPDLSNLKRLKKLVAFGCWKLRLILGLEELKSLMSLDICQCELIENSLDIPNINILTDDNVGRGWRKRELMELSFRRSGKENQTYFMQPDYDWSN